MRTTEGAAAIRASTAVRAGAVEGEPACRAQADIILEEPSWN
jgi:hypothetical protein